MKDGTERFVVLPFSLGCSTQSSVAVADTHHQHKKPNHYKSLGCSTQSSVAVADTDHQHKKPNHYKLLGCSTQSSVAVADIHPQHKKPNHLIKRREESDENGLFQKEDNGVNISDKIIRSFKSFSHYFIRYEEEREEREAEMEIELPTDVKHLSHIGADGIMTTFDSSFPFTGFPLAAV